MKIFFYGMEGVPYHVTVLTRIAETRGHEVGEPADVVFMMCWAQLAGSVAEAAKHAKPGKRVVALEASISSGELIRSFQGTGSVLSIAPAPFNETDAHWIIVALEQNATLR